MPRSLASTGCHLTPRTTSLHVLKKSCQYFACYASQANFILIFPSGTKSLIFFLFLLSPANSDTPIAIASFLLHLSIPFFLPFSSIQTCIFRVMDDVTAKYVLQKLQLLCHHCISFLSSCRLLLLQVMPLSHLHPSHSLLVQTCLVLYLSALLPYPQVRKLLGIQAQLKFGDRFSALVCISVLRALI